VVIEGAGMWRWAFLAPEYQEHEEMYATLWHSLMRWLTSGAGLLPGQTMSLRADKVRFGANESASVTLLVREEAAAARVPPIELIADAEGQVRSFAPAPLGDEAGVYRVSFGMLPEGRYHARIAGAREDDTSQTVVFDVRSYGEEHMNLQARPDLMARIAEDSGGAELDDDVATRIAAHFREHTARTRPAQVERVSAWDRWWLLAGVLALWSVSWAARRAGGLV
jgi:hypothetical protein